MTSAQLHEFLVSLGPSADEVAATLVRLGAKGHRFAECGCPVARAVATQYRVLHPRTGFNVLADLEHVRVFLATGGISVECETPEPVSDFMARFDNKAYPELVA